MRSVGDVYRGFCVTKIQPIHELQCSLVELTHQATGARVIHLANDDAENLFCLAFQTRPSSSNGVAHILEHTVLCGSEKFPVKDPFFAMTRRSLHTFMNALTGADFTCYPAASQIPKDFYQLLDVYMDAVFKPRLSEMSFKQEGHRLEFQTPSDSNTPLEYKGIVFNEMKGSLSSAMTRLIEATGAALFPDVTYGYNSGGDPKDIPSLTFAQLQEFHREYYHPSRCLFFFYGNMPLEGHLDFIAEQCLEQTQPLPPLPPVPLQPRFKQPVSVTCSYPEALEGDHDEKCYMNLAWLTCHILNQEDLLALSVLDSALMETDASPLRFAMLNSGLCKQADSSLDGEMNEVPWMFIFRGCQAKDAAALEACLRKAIEQIVRDGLPAKLIDSAIHQLELQRLEITGDSTPYGLSLFWRSGLLTQHGGKPEDGLLIHSLFTRLRERIAADPSYLTGLLRKYTLDNPHLARVMMVPDKELAAKELKDERTQLDAKLAKMTAEDKKHLVVETEQLAQFQKEQEEQDLDILPKLTLADVPPKARDFSLTREKVGNTTVFHHACFTNHIVYADYVVNLPGFAIEDLPLVRLLGRLLAEMGSGGRDYRATLEHMQAYTGGMDAAFNINMQAADEGRYFPAIHLRGKALYRNSQQFFELLRDMTTSVDFTDVKRLKEAIRKHVSAMESGLNSNALRYAVTLSASRLSPAGRLNNLWYGLDYFCRIRELAANLDQEADLLVNKLQELQKQLLHLDDPHLIITCDQEHYDQLKQNGFYGLAELSSTDAKVKPWREALPLVDIPSQGRLISSPVAFTAQVFPVVGYSHRDAGPLGLAAHLMENQTLHRQIREQGGAYGAGAVNSPMSSNFYFYSYRDPHLAKTLTAFDNAVDEIIAGDFTDDDLEEAKLEMIQDLDSPVAPGSRGALAYGWLMSGKTLALRQQNRDRILAATRGDIVKAVKNHVVLNRAEGSVVSFGGTDLLNKENQLLVDGGRHPLKLETV